MAEMAESKPDRTLHDQADLRTCCRRVLTGNYCFWIFHLLILVSICRWAIADPAPAEGTRRMTQALKDRINALGLENPYAMQGRASWLRRQIAVSTNLQEIFQLELSLSKEFLAGGSSQAALDEFNRLKTLIEARDPAGVARNRKALRAWIALCHLRIGEQENCLLNHGAESCLLPIQSGGIHQFQRGSRGAVQVLTEQLQEYPKDLTARWLLNIAYMTLGEYPKSVPSPWLIDPKTFASDYDIKHFPEVASGLGLDVDGLAGGSIIEDFDGDGYLDVLCSSMLWTGQLRYFRNNADGTFTERTREAGLAGEIGGLNIIQTDYNNDGFPDALVLRGGWQRQSGRFPNSLLRNNGNGTFTDVTEEAGLLSFHPKQTAVWFDYDGDGWLDLFIGNETTPGEEHPCELYHNNHNGTFTECSELSGVAIKGYVKAVISADFDNDGRPDLYLSRYGEPNILFHNDGPSEDKNPTHWKFTDVTARAGVQEPVDSFSAFFFDYDNDGWQDLFVSGYRMNNLDAVVADYLGLPNNGPRARLYHNNRDGTFKDVSAEMKVNRVLLTMGINYGDLDNDGWLDFYAGTGEQDLASLVPNRMFRNAEGKVFQDVTTSGGFGHLQKGHGISFADLDNDGDQDIYEVIGGAYGGDNYRNVLFENPGHGNHWITLKLEGVQSNRAALGARIKVTVKTAQGDRAIYKTVSSGGSFGASPFRQEIGLGQAESIRNIEIFWPTTGKTQVLDGVPMDHFYKVREGASQTEAWPLKSFKFHLLPDKSCGPFSS